MAVGVGVGVGVAVGHSGIPIYEMVTVVLQSALHCIIRATITIKLAS